MGVIDINPIIYNIFAIILYGVGIFLFFDVFISIIHTIFFFKDQPTYNLGYYSNQYLSFFCVSVFLFILLFKSEKENSEDYFIGFVLAPLFTYSFIYDKLQPTLTSYSHLFPKNLLFNQDGSYHTLLISVLLLFLYSIFLLKTQTLAITIGRIKSLFCGYIINHLIILITFLIIFNSSYLSNFNY